MLVIRGLGIALAVVLLLVGAAIAGMFTTIGQETVRGELASRLSTKLGRAVHIDGAMTLHLGRSIQISAADVRVANVTWGSRSDMLVASRVIVALDVASLFTRSPTLIVNQVQIDGLDLLLERTAQGANNWQFDTDLNDSSPSWFVGPPVVIERVALPGANVRFIGPRLDRPLDLHFDDVTQKRGTGDMLEFSAIGRANDADLSVVGQIGPFTNLIAAKAFSTSIDGRLGKLGLSVKARIDNLTKPVDSEADIELTGPDAAYVATTLGVRNLGTGPFNLTLSVTPSPGGKGVRGSLVGQIGEFDISGDGELSDPIQMGDFVLRTEVSGPDVSLLGGIFGIDQLPVERFHLAARVRGTGRVVEIDQADVELPDSALSLRGSIARIDKLAGSDLTFRVAGSSIEKFRELLHLPGIAAGPFEMAGTIHAAPTGNDVLEVTFTTALAKGSVSGSLGTYPDYLGTRLQFSVGGKDVAPFARQLGITTLPHAAFSANGRFELARAGIILRATTLSVGDDTLNIDGSLGKAPDFETAIRFGLQGKSLASVANSLGWTGLPQQPYKSAGQLQRRAGNTRLENFDLSSSGTRLQLSGTLPSDPKRDATWSFSLDGVELRTFKALVPDVSLPSGPFRAQGSLTHRSNRIALNKIGFTVAGSSGVVTADLALPLGSVARGHPNEFDVRANGPNLGLLVPDAPNSAVVNQKFDLRAKGLWNSDSWTFDSLRFDTPGGFVNVQGTLDRAPDYSATAMSVQARTTNLGATGRLFGVDLPSQALDFSATISGTPDTFEFQHVTGHFGETDFAGSVALDLQSKARLDIQLHSNYLDLTPLTDTVAANEPQPSPVKTDDRMIPNIALPSGLLDKIDARATIESAKANFLGETYDHLKLIGTLQDGRLTLDPLAFGGSDGDLTIRLSISSDLSAPNVRLVANGDQVRLGIVPGMNRTAAASLYSVRIDAAATGLNLRDLAATLNGQMRFIGQGGKVPRMSALSGDFLSELVRTLNPLSKRQEFTNVVCQAYLFGATSGVLKTDPVIVVRTTDIDVISNGSVDLRNETIDFNFKTSARGGLGFSAGELLNAYVKVSGTLNKPRLTVDPKGTLVNGGAAFATGGLSILATTLWDRLTRQSDPCAAAVAEADKRSSAKPSRW